MRTDLNDYRYFAEVVRHGGFTAAGRALHEPKSKLSRRVAELESRLGVRLIERTSRRFRVTEVGEAFYQRCRAILQEAEQAEALIVNANAEPQGLVRFSCPTGMVEVVSDTLMAYMHRYPKVRLQIVAVDRAVDLINERIDVALRVRTELNSDAELIMRTLGISHRILVASPELARRAGEDIAMLPALPTLGTNDDDPEVEWPLENQEKQRLPLRHMPVMSCSDFSAVRTAAREGLGIAFLPEHYCHQALEKGELVQIFPQWRSVPGIVHLVFTTRKGLPPAVRALIDSLAT
ncbi:LysR family transcriptional regulator, partial [Yokenella regensburgei]|uniref:LysR family transcriptional regulator n=1 Tax=Yokenella regensburgei TaxID=158877 RepID=UPI003F18A2E2